MIESRTLTFEGNLLGGNGRYAAATLVLCQIEDNGSIIRKYLWDEENPNDPMLDSSGNNEHGTYFNFSPSDISYAATLDTNYPMDELSPFKRDILASEQPELWDQGDIINFSTTGFDTISSAGNVLTVGEYYRCTFNYDVSQQTRIRCGTTIELFTGAGSFDKVIQCATTQQLYFQNNGSGSNTGDITNITVKRMTEMEIINWTESDEEQRP